MTTSPVRLRRRRDVVSRKAPPPAALLLLRAAPASASPERLALPQVFRLVGAAFLIAMALGELPPAFAIPAGLGDLAVGIAAPFVARGVSRKTAVWFHALGILDLAVALAVGVLLLPSTLAITELPLLLIPATLVPLALGLHVIALRRSFASRALLFVG